MKSLKRSLLLRLAPAALIVLTSLACEAGTSLEPDATFFSNGVAQSAVAHDSDPARGRIIVANRGSSSLSVVDTRTQAVRDVPMPDAGEPMYVVYVAAKNRVFVGDRANNRIVAFDARTLAVEGFVPAGDGVFHMWADQRGKQLWVVDNVGSTLTVIDPKRLEVIATVPVIGGVPHDVILSPKGDRAFATVFVANGPDQVVQYRTDTFEEVARVDVGEDPHLSINKQADLLFVPAQGASTVFALELSTLAQVAATPVPNAHGAAMTRNGSVFYTTNIADGGSDGVFALDARTQTVIGSADTQFPVPHNLALTPNGKQLYVTHSGATSDQLSICSMTTSNPVPTCDSSVTVGLNPFGLAYVP